MAETGSSTDYYLANVVTKKTPDELNVWWLRELLPIYHAFKVKFEGRRTSLAEKDDILSFRLARDENLGVFHVDLKDQPDLVWSDLPSTVQFATSDAPYGYLLLSDKWVDAQSATLNVDLQKYIEGGGKWPIGAGAEGLRKLIMERVSDKALQQLLLGLLENLLK
ncbi:hypothetical protein [Myxococcus sp. RHSTA-1-4]|uniref:hypothetical protein n=1 Tax=Myxococcus sp. RHSTA-1-4 TaxID=2874601 RepID=UPI001CBCB91D|nr:hypothetical protein [Myxococcus sp. RHSTA-1-4]MBZ4416192.1 hypothetical protein [Myxococcus sp. RHSTA-1-4]